MDILLHVQGFAVALHQHAQAAEDVADLTFGEEDDAAVDDDVGVRAVGAE